MNDPDANTLRESADDRIQAKIQAAHNKRAAAKRKRAQLAAARNHGLATRHSAKLARTTGDPDQPEEVH